MDLTHMEEFTLVDYGLKRKRENIDTMFLLSKKIVDDSIRVDNPKNAGNEHKLAENAE